MLHEERKSLRENLNPTAITKRDAIVPASSKEIIGDKTQEKNQKECARAKRAAGEHDERADTWRGSISPPQQIPSRSVQCQRTDRSLDHWDARKGGLRGDRRNVFAHSESFSRATNRKSFAPQVRRQLAQRVAKLTLLCVGARKLEDLLTNEINCSGKSGGIHF